MRAVPLEAAARWAALAARRHHDLEDVVVDATATSSSTDAVIQKLTSEAPRRWQATVCALSESLEVEVETTTPLPPTVVWVRNVSNHANRGIFHVASRKLSGVQMRSWKSRCGWRFGAKPTVAIDVDPPIPDSWEKVCKRCAYYRREALYEEHAAMLKGER